MIGNFMDTNKSERSNIEKEIDEKALSLAIKISNEFEGKSVDKLVTVEDWLRKFGRDVAEASGLGRSEGEVSPP